MVTAAIKTLGIHRDAIVEAIARYPAEQQKLLLDGWDFAETALGGSRDAFADELDYSWDSIYQAYTGRRESVDGICRAIESMLAHHGPAAGLIETVVTRNIRTQLDLARRTRSMAVVVGDTGRSKTSTCEDYARTHRNTIMVQVPSGCVRPALVAAIADAADIPIGKMRERAREHKLLTTLSKSTFLIVDEAGYLLRSHNRGASPIRLLQDLHDIAGIGIACVMRTPHWRELISGPGAEEDEQLVGRMIYRCIIPDYVMTDEIRAICEHFAEAPSKELLEEAYAIASAPVGDQGGAKLRTLIRDDLRKAKLFADANHETLTVEHLRDARDLRTSGGAWPKK